MEIGRDVIDTTANSIKNIYVFRLIFTNMSMRKLELKAQNL
jgi:hypothetical protein